MYTLYDDDTKEFVICKDEDSVNRIVLEFLCNCEDDFAVRHAIDDTKREKDMSQEEAKIEIIKKRIIPFMWRQFKNSDFAWIGHSYNGYGFTLRKLKKDVWISTYDLSSL